MGAAPLGYFWGDDAYSVARGPESLAASLRSEAGPPDRWRVAGAATSADEIAERVGTAPLFGGGTLVIVSEPAPLVASKPLAARLVDVFSAVAPGNGLAFLETIDGSDRRRASLEALQAAVAAAGGEVRQFAAPRQHEMARWIQERAVERGIHVAAPAAALLAERIGAFVREADVDRRRQGELAVSELEKLALYRLDAQIRPEDVSALVAESVPGSAWAFLDAVGMRRPGEAARLVQKLDGVPPPVIVVQLHRRIRELVEVADLLAAGAAPASLVRTLKLKPFRAERLAEQARQWSLDELDAALGGLLEVDAEIKRGGDGLAGVAIELWIAEKVARRSAPRGIGVQGRRQP